MKPKSLIDLTAKLNAIPGISKKQAEKIAYFLVQSDNEVGGSLVEAINKANEVICHCKVCHNLTEEDICYICKDKNRLTTIVVVESPLDVFKFEESDQSKVKYHVIGGLINVSKKIDFHDLDIESLKKRVVSAKEIILALSNTLEGIVTANYIKELLKDVKITQLAQGIPLGAAMEYVDELTLKAAFDDRKEIK